MNLFILQFVENNNERIIIMGKHISHYILKLIENLIK